MRTLTHVWYQTDDLVEPYAPYESVCIGVVAVEVSNIIGLSLWPPEEVYNDGKMDALIRSVDARGWDDRQPKDLELLKLPNGKYTVGNGGNHRPMLAKERRIEKIHALVDILIPIGEISKEVINAIDNIRRESEELAQKARRLSKVCHERGIYAEDYPEWNERERVWLQIEELDKQKEQLLQNEARSKGYL